jgi:replicative DNA helicase
MGTTNEATEGAVFIESVVTGLGLKLERNGRHLLGECPTGHTSQGGRCFSVNREGNFFNCFKCGAAGDAVGLVQLVQGLAFDEAVRWIADQVGGDLPDGAKLAKPANRPDMQAHYRRAALYDLVFEYGKVLLYEAEGKDALECLVYEWGYQIEKLKESDWIYFPPDQRIKDHLRKLQPEAGEQIVALKLQGSYGDNFRMAYPWRDRWGIITGFVKTVSGPKSVDTANHEGKKPREVRWDSTVDPDKHDLFNVQASRGEKGVILVEGYPDALHLSAFGIKGVVATGDGFLSGPHVAGLKSQGVQMATLCFGRVSPNVTGEGKAGEKAEKALEVLREAGLQSFVLDPASLAPHESPGEWLQERGPDAFRELLTSRVYGSEWGWSRVVDRYNLLDREEWTRAKDEGFRLAETITDPSEQHFFLEALRRDLAFNGDLFECARKDHLERRARKEREAGYRELHREMGRFLQEHNLDALDETLEEKVRNLRTKAVNRVTEPYTLGRLQEDMLQTPDELKTGYEELDKVVGIPQGALSIVAARPSHGGTAFLMNLLLNMAAANEERAFFFFSYNESRKRVALKLLNILSGKVIDEDRNLNLLERYVKGGYGSTPEIEKGKREFNLLTEKGRLWIIDEPYFVEDLVDTVVYLAERHNVGAIFIDSIHKIRTKGDHASKRADVQSVSERMLHTAKSVSLPIILGARVDRNRQRKDRIGLEDLKESGDVGRDAHLVLGLYSSAVEKAEEDGAYLTPSDLDLKVTVLKNRNGPTNQEVKLLFSRPLMKITEGVRDQGSGGRPHHLSCLRGAD